jgi:hypothetical protein
MMVEVGVHTYVSSVVRKRVCVRVVASTSQEEIMINMTYIIDRIKTLVWNKLIDTKYGWHDYIQGEIEDIDIDQLMTDRAEAYAEGMSEAHD